MKITLNHLIDSTTGEKLEIEVPLVSEGFPDALYKDEQDYRDSLDKNESAAYLAGKNLLEALKPSPSIPVTETEFYVFDKDFEYRSNVTYSEYFLKWFNIEDPELESITDRQSALEYILEKYL